MRRGFLDAKARARAATRALADSVVLEDLPLDLLARIVSQLDLRAAWRLRAASKALKDAVEAVEWASLILHVGADSRANLQRLEQLIATRRLVLHADCALLLDVADDEGARAACFSLVAAVAAATGGPARLEATVHLESDAGRRRTSDLSAYVWQNRTILHKTLAALRPAAGGQAQARVRDLSLACPSALWPDAVSALTPPDLVDAAWLRSALGHFKCLRSLALPAFAALCPAGAAALAACCPGLESLSAPLQSDAAVAALAPLPSLRRLAARAALPGPLPLGPGLAELAQGPAGRSLRSLAFSGAEGAVLSAAGALAVACMEGLEGVEGRLALAPGVARADLAEWGRLGRLRALSLAAASPEHLHGLADALGASLAPASLELAAPLYPDGEAVARALEAARGCLAACELSAEGPLEEPVARALAGCGPQLRRAALSHVVATRRDLAPYEAMEPLSRLGGGLSLTVETDSGERGADEALRRAASELLRRLFPRAALDVG
eukprot:tig00021348_g20606.t1